MAGTHLKLVGDIWRDFAQPIQLLKSAVGLIHFSVLLQLLTNNYFY